MRTSIEVSIDFIYMSAHQYARFLMVYESTLLMPEAKERNINIACCLPFDCILHTTIFVVYDQFHFYVNIN